MATLVLFGEQITWRRVIAVVAIAATAILFAKTVGELAVSVDNRYSVYPVGTDTNMYANSAIGQGIVCLLAAVAIGYILRRRFDEKLVAIAGVLFFVFMVASSQIQSFIPVDWCRYELTMHSCGDGLGYGSSVR